MKVVRYIADGAPGVAVGLLDGDTIAEVPGTGGEPGSLFQLNSAGLERVAASSIKSHKLDDVRLVNPVGSSPGKLLMIAGNYHPTDALLDKDTDNDTPSYFIKPRSALNDPDATIPANPIAVNMIEEIELGVVIGKPGKYVSREKAYDHIFGYTIVNDFSARDLDLPEGRDAGWFDWLNGKWLDGYCPIGPWIVPADELPDTTNLSLQTYINGDLRIDSNTNRMIWDIPRLIEYITKLCTLEPGDVIGTGVALGKDGADEMYIQRSDLIEGKIAGVGTLRNTMGR